MMRCLLVGALLALSIPAKADESAIAAAARSLLLYYGAARNEIAAVSNDEATVRRSDGSLLRVTRSPTDPCVFGLFDGDKPMSQVNFRNLTGFYSVRPERLPYWAVTFAGTGESAYCWMKGDNWLCSSGMYRGTLREGEAFIFARAILYVLETECRPGGPF